MKKKLFVCEMFKSIQGESTFAGLPCFFVRLTGCNLRCSYCDTTYSYTEGKSTSIAEIVNQARKSKAKLLEVTGGEPLLQENTLPLLQALLPLGTVLLETNGTLSIKNVPKSVRIIMDVKCPGSGEHHKLNQENLGLLTKKDEVKFVVSNKKDFEWAMAFIKEHKLNEMVGAILFSPAWGKVNPALLAKWILKSNMDIRFNPLLHKWLWPEKKRRV